VIVLLGFLSSLVIASLSELLPLAAPPRPAAWGAVALALPAASGLLPLLPRLFAGAAARILRSAPRERRRRARGQAALDLLLFAGAHASVLYPLGWARWTLIDLGWTANPFASIVLALLPAGGLALALAPLAHRRAVLSSAAGPAPQRFTRWLARRARWVLGPAIAFLFVPAAVSLSHRLPALRESLDVYPSLSVLGFAALVSVILAAAPALLLLAWPTRPFPPGPARDALVETARRAGVKLGCVRVGDEHTDGILNACVVGLVPGTHRVFFTRGLLRQLGPGEVLAVFCHELAHIARGHLACYSLLLLAFIASLGPLEKAVAGTPDWAIAILFVIFAALWWRLLFGALSRRLELEADLAAAGLAGLESYARCLARVGDLAGKAALRDSWRHFSIARRLGLLAEVAADPRRGDEVLATCRRAKRGVLALAAAAGVLFLSSAAVEILRPAGEVALERARAAVAHAEGLVLPPRRDRGEEGPVLFPWLSRHPESVETERRLHLERARSHLDAARRAFAHGPASDEDQEALEAIREIETFLDGREVEAGRSPLPPSGSGVRDVPRLLGARGARLEGEDQLPPRRALRQVEGDLVLHDRGRALESGLGGAEGNHAMGERLAVDGDRAERGSLVARQGVGLVDSGEDLVRKIDVECHGDDSLPGTVP
jgi:Zn-dependent protease with chaperone function